MKTINYKTIAIIGGISILASFLFLVAIFSNFRNVNAEAPSGLPARIASTSLYAVGPQFAETIFSTSTCSARVITTYANPIMITFSDILGQSPTGVFGHLQAASTTISYDSGIYGCGKLKVYGFNATTSITVTKSD